MIEKKIFMQKFSPENGKALHAKASEALKALKPFNEKYNQDLLNNTNLFVDTALTDVIMDMGENMHHCEIILGSDLSTLKGWESLHSQWEDIDNYSRVSMMDFIIYSVLGF